MKDILLGDVAGARILAEAMAEVVVKVIMQVEKVVKDIQCS